MNNREELLNQIASFDFAIVELHLFLDTHPNNSSAAAKLDEYIAKSNKLRKEFEDKYGPLNTMNEGQGTFQFPAPFLSIYTNG